MHHGKDVSSDMMPMHGWSTHPGSAKNIQIVQFYEGLWLIVFGELGRSSCSHSKSKSKPFETTCVFMTPLEAPVFAIDV
jgi:hypothetical protein